MKLSQLLAWVALSAVVGSASAGVMYLGKEITVKQPNGESIALVVKGNAYYAEQRTQSGRLVVYDKTKGAYCYATTNADRSQLISTGEVVTNATLGVNTKGVRAAPKNGMLGMEDAGDQPGLSNAAKSLRIKEKLAQMPPAHMHAKSQLSNSNLAAAPLNGPAAAPLSGAVKGLTVMVQFPDEKGTITQAQVLNYLNAEPYTEFGNYQSIRGYFKSVSNNKLDYTNVVPLYYTTKNNKAYYTDPKISQGVRAQEIITEALTWLNNTQNFDFSQLSVNASKNIRGLNFFYAGEIANAWGEGLWPHQWTMKTKFCADGVCASDYQFTNMGAKLAIGTFAHESGHLLFGWPDLYDYDNSSEGSAGDFCLMGSGSVGPLTQLRPVTPHASLRVDAGWAVATELNPALNPSAPKGALSLPANSQAIYKWTNPKNANEKFFIEAIQKAGQNLHQVDEGLAVWHYDSTGDNSTEWKPMYQLEHADGKRDPENNRNRGDATDLYDGVATKAFTDTLPNALTAKGTNSKWWDTTASGLSITNIGVPGANIAFTVGAAVVTPPGTTYSGSLAGTNQFAYAPSATGFVYTGGTIKVTTTGPTSTAVDFDVRIERKSATTNTWTRVALAETSGSVETLSYVAAAGTYRVVVYSYQGSGAYTVTITK
jgi:M6 family metalloprotease-like protein